MLDERELDEREFCICRGNLILARHDGAGEGGGADDLAGVAVAMFSDVDGEADGGDFQLGAADAAGLGELLWLQGTDGGVVAVEGGVDGGEQRVGIFVARAFSPQSGQLRGGERLATEVGEQAVRTACQVLTATPPMRSRAMVAAVVNAARFFFANFRSRYVEDGGHASTGSSLK